MIQTEFKSRVLPGYSQAELITGFVLVAMLVLGLLYMVNPLEDGEGVGESIPVYRAGNALYISNAIQAQQVAFASYVDQFGELPGDSSLPMVINGRRVVGNGNGKIEVSNGEKDKVFPELHRVGSVPRDYVRIRGKILEVAWMELRAGERVLGVGNFFKLAGVNSLEAMAYDIKFDDGYSDSGDVIFSKADDGVNLYIKLQLYK